MNERTKEALEAALAACKTPGQRAELRRAFAARGLLPQTGDQAQKAAPPAGGYGIHASGPRKGTKRLAPKPGSSISCHADCGELSEPGAILCTTCRRGQGPNPRRAQNATAAAPAGPLRYSTSGGFITTVDGQQAPKAKGAIDALRFAGPDGLACKAAFYETLNGRKDTKR